MILHKKVMDRYTPGFEHGYLEKVIVQIIGLIFMINDDWIKENDQTTSHLTN